MNEFIRRAEYTIRPPYCSRDNYIHKKVALNSLIAEKLLALEAGANNELIQNKEFQAYLRGRKEQTMRQLLYNNVAYKKVVLDTNDVKKKYILAGREYKSSYISFDDSNRVNIFVDELKKTGMSFEKLFQNIFGVEQIPKKNVKWNDQNEPVIHDALFSEPLKVGQLIGPIRSEDGRFLLMKIKGWDNHVAISNQDIKTRWNDVSDKLRKKYAAEIYSKFAANVMKEKEVNFSRDTFYKLVEIVAPHYLKSAQETKEEFNNVFWNKEITPDSIETNIEELISYPLLQIDGEVWTVEKFRNELRAHPLVFRKRRFSKKEFPEQYKLAIVDLIRDKYLAEKAYQMGYDKATVVERNTKMWEENFLSLYQKNKYLSSFDIKDKNYIKVIKEYLDDYVDSLQVVYNDKIEINTDEFEKIKLTNIDMFVVQKNVPFPIMMPGFPLLTTDNKLDYGKKVID
ncbi:hypothetical protein H8E88_23350 [candidate division KSB1 bacterium]|nr:hypothetical protein [candidate division KSB1 bacterium]MBL7093689.1 hypothetical protein [candidate division KSB1 bacterium]